MDIKCPEPILVINNEQELEAAFVKYGVETIEELDEELWTKYAVNLMINYDHIVK